MKPSLGMDRLPWSDKLHNGRDLFAPRAIAKQVFQYFLLSVAFFFFFRATSIYLAGPLESLTGTLNGHSSYLNPADLLTVTGSDGITNVLSPGKCLCLWTPPLSQSLGNPGEEQTSTCSAWLMPLMPGDCEVFTSYSEFVLSQELFGFGMRGGVGWGWGARMK